LSSTKTNKIYNKISKIRITSPSKTLKIPRINKLMALDLKILIYLKISKLMALDLKMLIALKIKKLMALKLIRAVLFIDELND
jgi:hypothetical protein